MTTRKNFKKKGFTLVELLVVITMLGILLGVLIIIFNPWLQLNKAKDAQRKHDFQQIRTALDQYYNDNNCYPQSLTFGQAWIVNGNTYMKKVPQDPDCNGAGICYNYQTDGSSCPQWNMLWAKLAITPAGNLRSTCVYGVCNKLPNAWCSANSKCNYCLPSGNLDCSVANQYLPFGGGVGGPTPPPIPTSTPTPPVFDPGCTYYYCPGGGQRCNLPGNYSQCSFNGGPYTCYCNDTTCGGNCP